MQVGRELEERAALGFGDCRTGTRDFRPRSFGDWREGHRKHTEKENIACVVQHYALLVLSAVANTKWRGEPRRRYRCRHDGDALGEQRRPSCWDTAWVSLNKALNITDGMIACGARIAMADTKWRGADVTAAIACVKVSKCRGWQQTTGRTASGLQSAPWPARCHLQLAMVEMEAVRMKLQMCSGSTAPYAPSDSSPPPQMVGGWSAVTCWHSCGEGTAICRGIWAISK
ncbi:hypothetical protein BC826DRAFT_975841, partial [Russula brevipes]